MIIITVLLVTTAGIGEAVFIIPILFTDTILGLILHGITTLGMIHGSIIPAITVLTMVIPITDITVGVDLITNLLIQAIMKLIAVRLPTVREVQIPLILQDREFFPVLPVEALLQDEVAILTQL